MALSVSARVAPCSSLAARATEWLSVTSRALMADSRLEPSERGLSGSCKTKHNGKSLIYYPSAIERGGQIQTLFIALKYYLRALFWTNFFFQIPTLSLKSLKDKTASCAEYSNEARNDGDDLI